MRIGKAMPVAWTAAILPFLLPLDLGAQYRRYDDWHSRIMDGMWGMGWVGMIFMILLWVLIAICGPRKATTKKTVSPCEFSRKVSGQNPFFRVFCGSVVKSYFGQT